MGFELKTLGTDWTCSCKSNYHAITVLADCSIVNLSLIIDICYHLFYCRIVNVFNSFFLFFSTMRGGLSLGGNCSYLLPPHRNILQQLVQQAYNFPQNFHPFVLYCVKITSMKNKLVKIMSVIFLWSTELKNVMYCSNLK